MDLELKEKIDLSAIDANLGRVGNQGFQLVDGFSGKAGQVVAAFDGTHTTFSGDNTGDGIADFVITVSGSWGGDVLVL